MNHLPLFFDLAGRKVVVVGEGPKADLRAQLAASAGADVHRLAGPVVSVEDFRGAVAAFVATSGEETDAAVYRQAKAAGVPVNVADRTALAVSQAREPALSPKSALARHVMSWAQSWGGGTAA